MNEKRKKKNAALEAAQEKQANRVVTAIVITLFALMIIGIILYSLYAA